MSKTTIGKAALLAAIALNLVACAHAPSSPVIAQTSVSQTVNAKSVDEAINQSFYGDSLGATAVKGSSAYRFILLINECCLPNCDTTRKLQIRLEMMEIMDQAFANLMLVKKPLVFGGSKYQLAINEATAGRACYSEFQKNRDQLKASDVHRDMLRHLVNIYSVTSLPGVVGNLPFMPISIKLSMFKELNSYVYPDGTVDLGVNKKLDRYTLFN